MFEARQITVQEREKWDAFICEEPAFSLLQSWAWGEFKEKLGWRAFRVAVESQNQIIAGAQVLIKPFPLRLGSIAYIPRGPLGQWLDGEIASILLSEIHRITQQQRAIFLRIEPPLLNEPKIDAFLRKYHFQPSSHTNQPKATIILDLSKNADDIFASFRKGVRKDIKQSIQKGVVARVGDFRDLPIFYELMNVTSQREKFPIRARKYYELEWQTFAELGQTALHLVSYEDQVLAAGMVSCLAQHAAQFHAGSIGKLTDVHPNHVLVWERIKWAKDRGCRTYDLWGIPDEIGEMSSEQVDVPDSDRTDGLWGVYRFKSGFCKNVVVYIGAYDFVYVPIPYAFIASKQIGRNVLEQLAAWADVHRNR